jgi:hypothetical protein
LADTHTDEMRSILEVGAEGLQKIRTGQARKSTRRMPWH